MGILGWFAFHTDREQLGIGHSQTGIRKNPPTTRHGIPLSCFWGLRRDIRMRVEQGMLRTASPSRTASRPVMMKRSVILSCRTWSGG